MSVLLIVLSCIAVYTLIGLAWAAFMKARHRYEEAVLKAKWEEDMGDRLRWRQWSDYRYRLVGDKCPKELHGTFWFVSMLLVLFVLPVSRWFGRGFGAFYNGLEAYFLGMFVDKKTAMTKERAMKKGMPEWTEIIKLPFRIKIGD